MMKLSELSPEVLARIRSLRYDRIVEKHEGPEEWASVLKYDHPEFLEIEGYQVLLPVERKHHPHITVLRCIVGDAGQNLTLFLKDTTFAKPYGPDEWIWAGFVAVCDRFPDHDFYIAVLYHEWFIIPPIAAGTVP